MKKLLHFVNPVYDVNVLHSENGSVSASPISGTYGTEVTLTNTPDEGYIFDRYELTGSTLYDGNKFRIRKSDVNVLGQFKTDIKVLCNLGSTQYGANTTFDLTGVPDSISERYVMYKTDLANLTGVNNVYYKSTAGSWRIRCPSGLPTHPTYGLGFVGITGIVSAWTTADGVTGISSFTENSVSYRKWSGFGETNDWRPMRIIIDQEELKAHTFLNGTYVGYATVKSGIVTAPIKQIQLQVEVNIRPQARNVRVVSSNDYQALVDWTDA